MPDPDAALALYEITQEMTERAGLPAYEISNHAAPGEESRHNLLYWRYGEYVGVGAGAHGRLVLDGRRHAIVTERQPERWLERVEGTGHGAMEITALSDAEQADEALLMGLRLAEGLDLDRLAAVGGLDPRNARHRRTDRPRLARMVRATPPARRQGRPLRAERGGAAARLGARACPAGRAHVS